MQSNSNVSTFSRVLPLSIRKEGQLSGHESPRSFEYNGRLEPSTSSSTSPSINNTSNSEQRELVRVSVSYPSPSCGTMNPYKEISIRLTNDENPAFFYHLRITETDFPEVKHTQGLLVDFFGFPNQLLTLLEKCDPNYSGGDDASSNSGPKFLLVMKIHAATNNVFLDFVESNPFKYLCHLSLKINVGSDAEVKKYLCEVTTALKREISLLQDKYSHLSAASSDEMVKLKNLLDMKTQEINSIRDELHAQTNTLVNKHFHEVAQEKEKILKVQADLSSKFDMEKSELQKKHEAALANCDERIKSLEDENRDLIQQKFKLETSSRELKSRMKTFEDDQKLLQQELALTRKQISKLDHDYHDKQRVVNTLQNKLTTLESDLREKETLLAKREEYIEQLSERNSALQDHATSRSSECEKIKSTCGSLSADLNKANEIIRKFQNDIRNLNAKMRLQSQITIEQERVISARDAKITSLESDLNSKTKSLETAESELTKTQKQLKDCEEKIEGFEKSLESKENMISWLNKQLNELQGLSNLTKFRQNLALSRSVNQSQGTNNENEKGDEITNGDSFRFNGTQNSTPGIGGGGGNSWAPPLQSTSTPLGPQNASHNSNANSTNNNSRTNGRVPTWAKSKGKVTLANSNASGSNTNNNSVGKQNAWKNY